MAIAAWLHVRVCEDTFWHRAVDYSRAATLLPLCVITAAGLIGRRDVCLLNTMFTCPAPLPTIPSTEAVAGRVFAAIIACVARVVFLSVPYSYCKVFYYFDHYVLWAALLLLSYRYYSDSGAFRCEQSAVFAHLLITRQCPICTNSIFRCLAGIGMFDSNLMRFDD